MKLKIDLIINDNNDIRVYIIYLSSCKIVRERYITIWYDIIITIIIITIIITIIIITIIITIIIITIITIYYTSSNYYHHDHDYLLIFKAYYKII